MIIIVLAVSASVTPAVIFVLVVVSIMAVVVTVVALCLLLVVVMPGNCHLCCPRGRSEGVKRELFTGEPILLVDEIKDDHSVLKKGVVNDNGDVKLCDPLTEIQQMQMADAALY